MTGAATPKPIEYAPPKVRPVLREDGRLYMCVEDAAIELVEQGNPSTVGGLANGIRNCCQGRGRTAGGHTWRWL